MAGLLDAGRSCYCGDLRADGVGKEFVLKGWVHHRRDHGGLIFIDLRDRFGICQVVLDPSDMDEGQFKQAHGLRAEFVIAVRGKLTNRIEGTVNDKMATGEVELRVEELLVLNTSKPVPFKLDEYAHINEDVRLKYRFLDLRRPEMQKHIILRAKVIRAVRAYLDGDDFLEIETPLLNKSTPEGARDFLVPSRMIAGSFYALPQSPQIFKQILMVAGLEKYYQVAKCFRDEDLRADRQPEFTQIDMELSFVTQEDIFAAVEGMLKHVYSEALGQEITIPFERMSHDDAMLNYGSDKPDLRFAMRIVELSETFASGGCEFKVFNKVLESSGVIRGICVPGGAEFYSNTQLKPDGELNKVVKTYGAGGVAWFRVEDASASESGGLVSSISKFFSAELLSRVREKCGAQTGDLILLVADKPRVAANALGHLRLHVAKGNDLVDESKPNWCWITDFPFFAWDEKSKSWEAEHHPFTMIRDEDVAALESGELGSVRALCYDLVFDGNEVASGSIRIHQQQVQSAMFRALGIDEETAQRKFGFLLDALQYGAPPHGGIALGLDRVLMLMAGEDSIREMIAFPKTQTGACLMSDAPSPVEQDQLVELNLELIETDED